MYRLVKTDTGERWAFDPCHVGYGRSDAAYRQDGGRWVFDADAYARGDDAGFVESEHPRDPGGKFSAGGSGGRSGGGSGTVRTAVRKGLGAARRFAEEDYHILREHLHMPGSGPRKKLGEHIASTARALPALLKGHLREEKQNAIHAAGALKALAGGNRPSPEQFKGLRAFGTRVLMTSASVAIGDPTGSVGHLATAFGHEAIQHVVVEHALKLFAGMGMLATKGKGKGRSDAMPDDEISDDDMQLLQRFIEALAEAARDLDEDTARELLEEDEGEDEDDARHDDADFEESDHPRDGDGQFTRGGGGGHAEAKSRSLLPTKGTGKERTQANGKPLPPHIASLKIPPGWSNVRYDPDPEADILVSGRDAKDRVVGIRSQTARSRGAAQKFARVKALAKIHKQVQARNDAAKKDPETREAAECLDLVLKMGLRPGSTRDTGAEKQAYGATTLKGRHVVQNTRGTFLRFTGKKGVSINLTVDDPSLAKTLASRAQKAGSGGTLFDVNNRTLLRHMRSVSGHDFKTKDLRTHIGTETAQRLVQSMPPPKNAKEAKAAILSVAKAVSSKLGNTPTIALQSYIAPEVFMGWSQAA